MTCCRFGLLEGFIAVAGVAMVRLYVRPVSFEFTFGFASPSSSLAAPIGDASATVSGVLATVAVDIEAVSSPGDAGIEDDVIERPAFDLTRRDINDKRS